MASKAKTASDKTQKRRDSQATLMKLILEKKDVLLGKFESPDGPMTHQNQMDEWEKVRKAAVELGCDTLKDKTAHHLRYSVFSTFKTRTVAKYDASKQTGAKGLRLTEVTFFEFTFTCISCFKGGKSFVRYCRTRFATNCRSRCGRIGWSNNLKQRRRKLFGHGRRKWRKPFTSGFSVRRVRTQSNFGK